MSDPYIPAEDRIDVIGRLTARLDDGGPETLREKAAAHAAAMSTEGPPTIIKPVKDEGEKEDKDNKDTKDGDEKDQKEDKDFKDEKDGVKDDKDSGKDDKDFKEHKDGTIRTCRRMIRRKRCSRAPTTCR